MFPITVVKGKDEALVFHPIDLQDWLSAGWKLKEEKPVKA